MQPVIYVRTNQELIPALDALSGADYVAMDTEFMRESTYYPKLCLIQLAAGTQCVLIDTLGVTDLTPFMEFLAPRTRTKVIHSARQDLEVIFCGPTPAANGVPGPIFDTQIAAALLGASAQVGYGTLVEQQLGVTLPKGHTRTDWSRRPLSEEQLQYAADDARYLAPLYERLRTDLERAGRLEWLIEETQELEDPTLYRVEPEAAWRRLKGLDRLQPAQRQAAKKLAQWREQRAIAKDKPRGWILSDESLRELAERLPTSLAQLESLRTVPAGLIRRRGEELLALLEAAQAEAAGDTTPASTWKPESEQLARVTRLMAAVRSRAEELKISPEVLATRRMVEQLVFSQRTDALLKGWRREAIGERLIALAETR